MRSRFELNVLPYTSRVLNFRNWLLISTVLFGGTAYAGCWYQQQYVCTWYGGNDYECHWENKYVCTPDVPTPSANFVAAEVTEGELNAAWPNYVVGKENSLEELLLAVNRYAGHRGFVGLPTFERGETGTWKINMYRGLDWKDATVAELLATKAGFDPNNKADVWRWNMASGLWAANRGYLAGFPTYEIGQNGLRGVNLIKGDRAKFFDVSEQALHAVDNDFVVGQDNSFPVWTRAINRLGTARGCRGAIPNYFIGKDRVRGVVCMN